MGNMRSSPNAVSGDYLVDAVSGVLVNPILDTLACNLECDCGYQIPRGQLAKQTVLIYFAANSYLHSRQQNLGGNCKCASEPHSFLLTLCRTLRSPRSG